MSKSSNDIERIEKLSQKLSHPLIDCRLRAAKNLLFKFENNIINRIIYGSLTCCKLLSQDINLALKVIVNETIQSMSILTHQDKEFLHCLFKIIRIVCDSITVTVELKSLDQLTALLDNLYKINSLEGVDSTTSQYLTEVCVVICLCILCIMYCLILSKGY